MSKKVMGHVFALFAIIIWGLTFISTAVLLDVLDPIEIMVFRFGMAFLLLCAIYPKNFKFLSLKEEFIFFILGLSGVSLYFIAENISLTYTLPSNVAFILTTAPLYTAIIAHFFSQDEKFDKSILVGFAFCIIGVFFVMYNSQVKLAINPLGDFLALAAAVMWGIYSVSLRKLTGNYHPIYMVRKTFFYGILTTLPFIKLFGADMVSKGWSANIIFNLIFLGIVASALCYVLWNKAVMLIGSVQATNYIYLIPLVTVIGSFIFLKHKLEPLMIFGGVLIIVGVVIADKWKAKKMGDVEDVKKVA
ncbi:DMT family transporter [Vallitalea pronyensis]|uniref:DMT family transporter n=1 Tax=Vallitalea pronyensis TaxID=1348613 RepID=A0A8J8SH58_9FIRM|nr:DMT family transporter [Vallitalea pronyensis]QUI23067.1 DMT family transporter [Vallitalea pronyensis]